MRVLSCAFWDIDGDAVLKLARDAQYWHSALYWFLFTDYWRFAA